MVMEHPEDGRAWAEGHARWSDFASGLIDSVRDAFEALAEIQFDAPWKAQVRNEDPCRGA